MSTQTYKAVGKALAWLVEHREEQPDLTGLASAMGVSPHHLQRLFTRWVGISPKKFLQFLTLDAAKKRLVHSVSVLDATLDAGLSGPGRLHDLFVTFEAMTPGEYKARGKGLEIHYGVHDTPFGDCLIAETDRGVCGIGFVDVVGLRAGLDDFRGRWPAANFTKDTARTAITAARIFPAEQSSTQGDGSPLRLLVRGTPFQIKVWEALLAIPPGCLTTYSALAKSIGKHPGAARAVGQAVGANPISWLIPCHRVIRESGALSGYHWGLPRKLGMMGWEAAKHPPDSASGEAVSLGGREAL